MPPAPPGYGKPWLTGQRQGKARAAREVRGGARVARALRRGLAEVAGGKSERE